MSTQTPGLGSPDWVRVLSYDHILYRGEPVVSTRDVCEAAFIRHMELLDKWGFTTITFEDLTLYEQGKLNLPLQPVVLTFNGATKTLYQREFAFLRSLGMRGVVFALGDQSQYIRELRQEGSNIPPAMNEQQLLELHEYGFEIGSMSVSGRPLTTMDREEAWQEISRSRMALEFILNAPVRSFAYPEGLTNEQVKHLVAQAGYEFACALCSGPRSFGADPYHIRRIIAPNSTSSFRLWTALHRIPLPV